MFFINSHTESKTQPRPSNQTLLSRGIPIILPRTWKWMVEATHSLLLSRKKHMDILGKMGVMPVSARKSIGGRDYEQVWCF